MSELPEKKPPQDLLDWLGYTDAPNWGAARPVGRIFGAFVLVVFAAAIAAAVSVLYGTIRDVLFSETPQGPNLGAGALIAALLGAPFLIWGTVLKHQTVRWQKEGHMTDRISKAVEQLGAEKKVDRIGRPITVTFGHPEYSEPEEISQETLIEWLGTPHKPKEGGWISKTGDWQAFSESLPNLEVRIGAILSLERIAQDSTTHDKGRDHVRVMEILCAYIRENASTDTAEANPYGEWQPLKQNATDAERTSHQRLGEQRFGVHPAMGVVRYWAQDLGSPREDIALALSVIGRRTPDQRRVEAAWPDAPDLQTEWVFDRTCPTFPQRSDDGAPTARALAEFETTIVEWAKIVDSYRGYRLDLRWANLQGANLEGAVLSGAHLEKARMEGAHLGQVRLERAFLMDAHLEGADLNNARLEGANLREARLEEANLRHARLQGAYLVEARLEGTSCGKAHFHGAQLFGIRTEKARGTPFGLDMTRSVGTLNFGLPPAGEVY